MGLFSLVGSFLGAGAQKKASHKAEQAMLAYLDKAIGEESRQYDQTRADFSPFLQTGTAAVQPLGDLAGVNGNDKWATAIEQLKASPLYQSLFRSGEEAVLSNASATGGLRGGNTERSLADFGSDTLAKTIIQQLQTLGGVANMGQEAAGSVGAFGANKANTVASLFGDQGSARAGGLLTRGGINAGMWNNIGGFLDQAVQAALGGIGGIPGGGSNVMAGLGAGTGF
jgi:hypothetical protein